MQRDERGSAVVLVLMCATLFLALGGALVTLASTDATISATFRESAAALAGAEAALARVTADLTTTADWNAALSGRTISGFQDGTDAGSRRLPDGTLLDLTTATNVERCGNPSCTDAQIEAMTADRPWGMNNPRWQRYASGPLRAITPSSNDAPHVYVIVWVGDDPLETDADPLTDDPNPAALGHDAILLRATAYGAYSVRRRLEVRARRDDGVVRLSLWREIR